MTSPSPHLYLRNGRALGYPDDLIRTSLAAWTALETRGVTAVLTLGHLAHRTRVPYQYLRGIVERASDPYRAFEIARRHGKVGRRISTPEPILMHVQRWILRRILDRLSPHPSSYAYVRNRSALSCARQHVGARWLLKLDLHDFFHSLDERRVYKIFAEAGYSRLVSFELSRLCTRAVYVGHDNLRPYPRRFDNGIQAYQTSVVGVLPQGSPTSGALANLASVEFDSSLTEFAQQNSFVYTRYSDDLVFSSVEDFSRNDAERYLRGIESIAQVHGFVVHKRKTRIVPPGARKIVLGLVVGSSDVHLTANYKSRLNTHIRGVQNFGLHAHRTHMNFSSSFGFIHHLDGLLAHALQVDPAWTEPLRSQWNGLLSDMGIRSGPRG